jgi:archaellum biogenesis ATPase FlaH
MPTFQSIPLHPILRQRLLQPPEQELATNTNVNNVGNSTSSCASSSMAIGTPQALLSRSPHQILQLLQSHAADETAETTAGMAMAHIDSLRHQVAQAMMTKTHTGKHNQRIRKTLSQQQEATHSTQPSFLTGSGTGTGTACSVLELCRYQQQQQQQQSSISLTTGCQALDLLLSFPNELLDLNARELLSGPPTSQSNNTIGRSCWLPIMGHVLQVSGHAGTGKTQLMLQLALQMAQQQGCQVHYLASSAGHSSPLLASRLVQLAAGCSSDSSTSSTADSIMSQISFQSIRSTQELVIALSRFQQLQEDETADSPPRLFIVDSLSAMLVDADSNMTTRIETWMKQLAHLYNITVCATMNHTTTSTNNNNINFDIHVGLEASPTSTSTSSIRATLLQHPAKLVIPENPPTLELVLTPLGMTTP